MKYLVIFVVLLGLAGCTGVPTGRKSPCYGKQKSWAAHFADPDRIAQGVKVVEDECDFIRF